MGNIVLLDDLTINKIAAGEVIERPASVIKEMVENSIDAGAKNITVEIKNGGISFIRVTDDGDGIAEDDMEIAFERHATSKIRKAEDLEIITSMGFRGEALASIAAIANVEMISRKANEEIAHKIVIEGGKVLEKEETVRSVGTTLTVQNLFYNTPVRYKFLKKDYTEAGYIEDAVTRIALMHKDVAIKLINNGKTIVQTSGNGDLKTVIYSIYGKDIASEIIEIDYTYEDIKVSGVIGKPVIARGNRSHQLFFVNDRYIKDKNLTAAAEQAYKGMIPVGRYGFVILNVIMNPKMVDVNVHPAKLEVRFEEEGKVFKAIYHAIKSGLAKSELVENVEKETEAEKANDMSTMLVNEDKATYDSINNTDNEMNIEETNEKKGISGLFHKLIKEPDETEEERNNNHLEEIFKFRQGLAELGIAPTSAMPVEQLIEETDKKEEKNEEVEQDKEDKGKQENIEEKQTDEVDDKAVTQNLVNHAEIDKTVIIEGTSISSDTGEINVTEGNDSIENHTQKLEENTTLENHQQDTQVLDAMQTEEKIHAKESNYHEQDIKKEDSFATVAEKFMEEKLKLDNTQMVDTVKVRQALKENVTEDNPEFDVMYKKTFGIDPISVRKEKKLEKEENAKINASGDFTYATSENESVFDNQEEFPEIPYKFLGIAFNTYIIIEIKNEIYLIDQHAAHERIMYEKVKTNYYNETMKDEQFLLLPDVITLTHKEMAIARENIGMFAKAGFSFEEFGENTIKLTAVPSMCENLNTKQLFLDILDEIDTVAVTARQEKEDKFIATVACKAAVKAKMKLDEKEVDSLLQKLLALPNPFTCPHGRPTAIKMTKYDLERKFSRK